MKILGFISIGLIGLIISLAACSGDSGKDENTAEDFLLSEISTTDIKKVSGNATYPGDSLFEYINGGAEIYHTYDFIEVATADYKCGEDDLVLDIYRFDNADYAFGLYTALRPPEPDIIALGVEGYISSTRLEVLKDKFLIRLTAYKDSPEISSAMKSFAAEIEKIIPGRTTIPSAFSLFPEGNIIPGTDRLQAESYLGQVFLTDVYTREYLLNDVAVTVFLTDDSTASKYDQWQEVLNTRGGIENTPGGLNFDDRRAFIVPESYYGQIIAGIKGGHLLGIVGYLPEHRDFINNWLESLSP